MDVARKVMSIRFGQDRLKDISLRQRPETEIDETSCSLPCISFLLPRPQMRRYVLRRHNFLIVDGMVRWSWYIFNGPIVVLGLLFSTVAWQNTFIENSCDYLLSTACTVTRKENHTSPCNMHSIDWIRQGLPERTNSCPRLRWLEIHVLSYNFLCGSLCRIVLNLPCLLLFSQADSNRSFIEAQNSDIVFIFIYHTYHLQTQIPGR